MLVIMTLSGCTVTIEPNNNTFKEEGHSVLTGDVLRIEDYFDLSKLTEKDVRLISNDIRVFIPHTFDEILSDEGEILIKESTYLTLPVNQVRKELKKLGFLDWQIKSEIRANKVKIIILYADIDKNTDIVVNKMLTCGWSKARISKPQYIYGTLFRVMDFDPIEQDSLTKEARFHKYLYHLTPHHNVDSILQNGIEARNENDYLSYPPRAHLIKGDVTKNIISNFGWMLYNKNKRLQDGRYDLVRIDVSKVPHNIEFYGDPRFEYGYFTKDNIPPSAIELYGYIEYKDKYNYNNEIVHLFNDNTDKISI